MFIFAHVFCGALIGLAFWHHANDRRALPLCILGAILPDLIDKPLAMIFPGLLGSGRTIGHAFIFVALVFFAAILLWHYRHSILGIGFCCAVFSHQILDAMWTLVSTWFYPLLGPFPVFIMPDYAGQYFWIEISTLSEWVFGCASLIIVGAWYVSIPERRVSFLNSLHKTSVRFAAAIVLGVMGVYLLVFGLFALPSAFFAPAYSPVTDAMAGMIALSGAVVLAGWQNIPARG